MKISHLAKKRAYIKQNEFYKGAYNESSTPWTGDGEPSPDLVEAVRKIKRGLKNRLALDLGSGEGRHTNFLQGEGFRVIGLEYQKKALEKATGKKKKGLMYLRADLFNIPLKPSSFDLLIDYGVFHHIRRKDTAAYINLLDDLLVRGGYLLLSCFSRSFMHADGKKYKRGFVVHKNHYDRFSTKPEIREVFGSRFRVLEVTAKSSGFLYTIIQAR